MKLLPTKIVNRKKKKYFAKIEMKEIMPKTYKYSHKQISTFVFNFVFIFYLLLKIIKFLSKKQNKRL